ncbi:unnamed protein product [Phyllotreta striolata]|uniref:Uncharacterized protein n=1 Tax=Phyllotreta striolata TaxID=444603 RepID=A0A9N9TVT4_PHYSR|nr:unnamed protein product [Phyllotreta striolata]
MSDPEDEDEIEINFDDLAEAIRKDFMTTARETRQITENVKQDLNRFVQSKSQTLAQGFDIENTDRRQTATGADIITVSINKMHHKAAQDFEAIRLFDEYMVHEKSRFLREQFFNQIINDFPEKFYTDFNNMEELTEAKIDRLKKHLHLEDANEFDTLRLRILNDLDKMNELMQKEIDDIKLKLMHFANSIEDAVPDASELTNASDLHLNVNLLPSSDKITDDIWHVKTTADEKSERMKNNISSFLDNFQDAISDNDFTANGFNTALPDITEAISVQSEVFGERSEKLKTTWQFLGDITANFSEDIRSKRAEMSGQVEEVSKDILETLNTIKEKVGSNKIEPIEVPDLNINIDINMQDQIAEIQEEVQSLKQKLESTLKSIKLDTPKSDLDSKEISAVLRDLKEKVTSTYRETETNMNHDIDRLKSKISDPETNPIFSMSFDEVKTHCHKKFNEIEKQMREKNIEIKKMILKKLEEFSDIYPIGQM